MSEKQNHVAVPAGRTPAARTNPTMAFSGAEQRMAILRSAADQKIVKPFRTHGWTAQIVEVNLGGDYLVVTAERESATRKIALLYSSATDNMYYKKLASEVDCIFINGGVYQIESYAHGVEKPVVALDEFFPILVAWNKDLHPDTGGSLLRQRRSSVYIKAENPLTSIWARLDQFASTYLAEKLIRRRAEEQSIGIPDDRVQSKGIGVAFSLRSASDYFRASASESLNKRILSLYYGGLALSFAEMLSSPKGPSDLDELQGYTTQGHGLYTLGTAQRGFGELLVGILATGFLPRWADFLGHDVSSYPKARARSDSEAEKLPPNTSCTLRNLLSAVPEISDLFSAVFGREASWIMPIYDHEANLGRHHMTSTSTYITMNDQSGCIKQERLELAGWPLAEISQITGCGEGHMFRVRVDHPQGSFWQEVLPLHQSPFENGGALILPPLSALHEYRVIAMAILYALSILVRYMPLTWRRVEGGDLDQHLALVKTTIGVFERILPQEFLEAITGERIIAAQPGDSSGDLCGASLPERASSVGVMNRRPATPAPPLIDGGVPKFYALDLCDLPYADTTDPADLSGNCGCIWIDVERRGASTKPILPSAVRL